MSFIMLWKVTGALEKPKYMMVASKKASPCNKCCLPFIPFFDANIVVSPPQVNFGKD